MKLRVMGTKDECLLAQEYYRALERQDNVQFVSVSELYPNRGSSTLFRVYIEIMYKSETEELQRLICGRITLHPEGDDDENN